MNVIIVLTDGAYIPCRQQEWPNHGKSFFKPNTSIVVHAYMLNIPYISILALAVLFNLSWY